MLKGTLTRDRRVWIGEQLQERQQQRERERDDQVAAFEREKETLWTPFAHEAQQTGELNIAWKQARGFLTYERVIQFRSLLALRITGHDLRDLPDALFEALPALETVSLLADEVERLPTSIGTLRNLTELDLTKNRLCELPDSVTSLLTLKTLNLSCNALEKLPQDIGKLVQLDKLCLEHNALNQLPFSIGGCQNMRSANFSENSLTELPESIGELTALTSLSVNLNKLQELPDAIVRLPKLRLLNASRNQLTKLPRNIGDMQTLRELRLDWNSIQELPFSFRALTGLQLLCMEQNPLRLPTSDVIARGVPTTLEFMEKALAEFQRSSRRELVEALQEVLAFAAQIIQNFELQVNSEKAIKDQSRANDSANDADLCTIMSFFEPMCDRLAPVGSNNELKLYGIVWDSFYSELLPAIERQQEFLVANESSAKPATARSRFSQRFSSEEVEDAVIHYDDEFGLVCVAGGGELVPVPIEFRRCACIDLVALRERGQRVRKVCLPRTAPYHCQRLGRLLRAEMLTKEQAQDQLASVYLRTKVARLVQKTRRRAIEYINSPTGVAHFERTARLLAHEMKQRRRRLRKLYKQHEKSQRRVDARRDKLRRKIEAFERAKEARLKTTRDQCVRLEKDRDALERQLDLVNTVAKTKKLAKLEDKLARLRAELEEAKSMFGGPEKTKIYELELAIEGLDMEERKLHKATKKARAEEMDADIEEEEKEDERENEEEDDGDDSGDEEDNGSEEDSDEEEAPETEAVKVSSRADPPTKSFFDVDMPDMSIEDYRKAAVRTVDQELEKRALGDHKSRNSSVTTKFSFLMPVDVPEEVLFELFQAQIRGSYVEMQCTRVSHQTTREFLQMRAVLQRWRGLSTRSVFEAWHDVARARKFDATAVKLRAERKKELETQNRELEEQLARLEARRWVQRTDMYTDAIYYENEATGETRWEPPQYWTEELQHKQTERQRATDDHIPRLKLPPI